MRAWVCWKSASYWPKRSFRSSGIGRELYLLRASFATFLHQGSIDKNGEIVRRKFCCFSEFVLEDIRLLVVNIFQFSRLYHFARFFALISVILGISIVFARFISNRNLRLYFCFTSMLLFLLGRLRRVRRRTYTKPCSRRLTMIRSRASTEEHPSTRWASTRGRQV